MKAFSAHAFQPLAFAKRKSLAGGRSYEPTQKQWCSWQVQAQALSHRESLLEDSMEAVTGYRERIRPGTYLVHKGIRLAAATQIEVRDILPQPPRFDPEVELPLARWRSASRCDQT